MNEVNAGKNDNTMMMMIMTSVTIGSLILIASLLHFTPILFSLPFSPLISPLLSSPLLSPLHFSSLSSSLFFCPLLSSPLSTFASLPLCPSYLYHSGQFILLTLKPTPQQILKLCPLFTPAQKAEKKTKRFYMEEDNKIVK